MDQLKRVLILEENTDHLELLTGILEEHFSPIDIHTVESVEDCMDFLEQTQYDIILSGCFIHKLCITERLASIIELARGAPIIVISGSGDENIAADVIKRGANEYIVKTRKSLEKLPNVVEKYFKKGLKKLEPQPLQSNESSIHILREIDHLMQKARSLTTKEDANDLESLFSQIHRLRKLIQDRK